ncbi:preprotein translocase subunit YajC [Thermomonospora cellulosilytica]|uniref:Preprotein translocase subunit YajC n=1 Tax=Thermomonospora cellulosilytica TaxID=1411118 RepID=A0A7W3N067_9ACTN|nr:preprotein translocase subunit YajC [Thermomonospora cellulosilytica]MBA9005110.1 preprotein translocase subunit YajC [Thermomonospora cellulosilytica]
MGDSMFLAQQSGGSGVFNLILLLAIPVVFYLLLIRPQNKRRREQMQMQSSLRPGVRVMTTSGMYAEVTEVDDDGVVLEIAPGVRVRFVKAAIMNIVSDDDVKGGDAVDLDKDADADAAEDEQKADKPSA